MNMMLMTAITMLLTMGSAPNALSQVSTPMIDTLPQDGSLILLSPVAMPGTSNVSEDVETVKVPSKACRLSGSGLVEGEMRKFRITLRNQVLAAGDSLEEMAEAAARLEEERECAFQASAVCRLTDEGPAGGDWHRARIEMNGRVVTGADGFHELAPALLALGEAGFCHFAAQECSLAAEGAVGGAWWKHRLVVDGAPVLGAADLGGIAEQAAFLRSVGVCR